jgi:hypothetical protein
MAILSVCRRPDMTSSPIVQREGFRDLASIRREAVLAPSMNSRHLIGWSIGPGYPAVRNTKAVTTAPVVGIARAVAVAAALYACRSKIADQSST